MVRELKITIITSTDTRGGSIEIMEEMLSSIVDKIANMKDGESYTTIEGDVEEHGWEASATYQITKIQ